MDQVEREKYIIENTGALLEQMMPGHAFTSVGFNRFTHDESGTYVELWPEPVEPGFETILMYVLFSASSAPQATQIFIADNGAWAPWEKPARPQYLEKASLAASGLARLSRKAASLIFTYVVLIILAVLFSMWGIVFMLVPIIFLWKSLRDENEPVPEIGENMTTRRLCTNFFIISFFFVISLMVPGRALYQIVAFLTHTEMHVSPMYYGVFLETVVGLCGLATGVMAMIIITNLTFQMRRQIKNLPTSTVAGTAIGLVELRGVVRPASGMGPNEPVVFWKNPRGKDSEPFRNARRFYLEDSTGRILVEPRGVPLSVSGYSMDYIGKSTSRIILSKTPSTALYSKTADIIDDLYFTDPEKDKDIKAFFPGDPVYVIGYACERENVASYAEGPDRLIVRPRVLESHKPFSFLDTFDIKYLYKYFVSSKDYLNVFIMADTDDERVVNKFVSLSSSVEIKGSVFMIVCSLILIILVNL